MDKILYPMKLNPVFKSAIWGGKRLNKGDIIARDYIARESIAEAWLLTVRDDGMNVIENGIYKDMTLSNYLNQYEQDFPLLVKIIDAGDKLSIQVHPNKTEAWYIIDADEDAQLVYGFKKNYTIEEIKLALDNNYIEDLLNYVNVKSGEIYFIPTGLVHAIGGGILIAEIQQNSNITYRLYDYNRRQADGTLRQLHIEDSLKSIKHFDNLKIDTNDCDFFTFNKYDITTNMTVSATDCFKHVLCIDGTGYIDDEKICKNDSYFIPQGLDNVNISTDDKLSIIISQAKV